MRRKMVIVANSGESKAKITISYEKIGWKSDVETGFLNLTDRIAKAIQEQYHFSDVKKL